MEPWTAIDAVRYEEEMVAERNQAKEQEKEFLRRKNKELRDSLRDELANFVFVYGYQRKVDGWTEQLERLRAKLEIVNDEMAVNYERMVQLEQEKIRSG